MGQKISPVVAVVVILVVIGVAAFAWFKIEGSRAGGSAEKATSTPPEVSAALQKVMGNMKSGGQTAPTGGGSQATPGLSGPATTAPAPAGGGQ